MEIIRKRFVRTPIHIELCRRWSADIKRPGGLNVGAICLRREIANRCSAQDVALVRSPSRAILTSLCRLHFTL